LLLQEGVGNPTDSFLAGQKSLFGGINDIGANIGNSTDSFLAGQKSLFGGLNDIKFAVGSPSDVYPAQKSLFAGVRAIKAGVGSASNPLSLLGGVGNPTDSATAGQRTLFGALNDIKGGVGSPTANPSLLYGANAVFGGLTQIKGAVSTGSQANPGLLEGLEQLGSGLNEAVAGLGSPSNSNSLIGGSTAMASGLEQLKAGLVQASTGVTGQMQPAIGDSLKQLDVTMGQLEAIRQRGQKFDTFMGRVENTGSTSDMRFLLQTKPVQNPNHGNGWLIALVISLVGGAALVVLGLFAFKRYA
jgi:putative membrane protein